MTREEILAMEPGHELNSLVIDEIGFNIQEPTLFKPSAWEVVEELNGKYAFEIGRAGDYFEPERPWRARFGMSGYVECESASEAICKAALLAVMANRT